MASEATQAPTPLANEDRDAVDTRTAAHHLNRAQQTLRIWACYESGPLRPIRINGRLAWPTSEIRRLLGSSTVSIRALTRDIETVPACEAICPEEKTGGAK
jgi:hypothetical protein